MRSPVTFLATAEPRDAEMRRRIAAHRRERPKGWRLVEESRRADEALARLPRGSAVLLDCVTLWVGRMVSDGMDEATIRRRVTAAVAAIRSRGLQVVAVSNEAGSGVVPATRLGRRFQDALGEANAALAAAADRVELLVAGIPIRIK
jgi:adenosylcobinamide kinase/adenosylcobinamide-phosphate guanylyltransferase